MDYEKKHKMHIMCIKMCKKCSNYSNNIERCNRENIILKKWHLGGRNNCITFILRFMVRFYYLSQLRNILHSLQFSTYKRSSSTYCRWHKG